MAEQIKYVSLANLDYYDDKIKSHIADADAALKTNLEGQVEVVANALDGEITRAKAAEATNAAAAQAAQTDVDNLEKLVGTLPEGATAATVVAYVDEKTSGIATDAALTELNDKVTALQGDVKAIEDDYLVEADKTELADAIAAETTRATGIEDGLRTDVDAIKTDYLKAADKTELQSSINVNAQSIAAVKEDVDAFFADADMTESAKDTLKELQAYIASDETAASEMLASIKQNSDDIGALETSVSNKAEQSALESEETARTQADSALDTRLKAVESAVGESGSVSQDISEAKDEAVSTAAADATTKANTAESNAKSYADTLNTSMNTRVEALEAIDHDHSNKTVLDGITAAKVADWDDAVTKEHEHSNKTVLDGITAENITTWNTVTSKAAQTDLDDAVTKITANEAAIAAFEECTEADINALFA